MKQNRDIKGVNALAKRLGVFFFPGMNAWVKEVRSKRFGGYLTQRFSAGIQPANDSRESKGVNALFKDSGFALFTGMNAWVKEVRSKRFGSYLTQRFSAGIQLANETWVSKGVNALFKDSPLALIARHECLGEGGKRQPL